MKKLIWSVLTVWTMQSHAQTVEHEVLWQWLDPVFQIGTQQAFDEDEEKDPLYQSCVKQIFNVHVLPVVKAQTIQSTVEGEHAADAQALEEFMSQEQELVEYQIKRKKFDQLTAKGQHKEAEAVWDSYMQQAIQRMPNQAQAGAVGLVDALNVSAALEDLNFKSAMLAEPVCIEYIKSLD